MKYNKTPSISMLVVTNGPVAIAGSISSFLSIKGENVPTPVASTIDAQILKPTTRPITGSVSTNLKMANIPNKKP